MFLTEIIELKKKRLEIAKSKRDFEDLKNSAIARRKTSKHHRLRENLERNEINIIAEIKRASPSKGVINEQIDVAEVARNYENAGACAISVLTEEDKFQGSLDDLRTARESVSLPILRKDFIFDEFQIYEAADAGADVILLIAAMLDDDDLAKLHRLAEETLGLDALVEVHTLEELERVKTIGASLIGVNNRDLHSFQVSLDVSRELIKHAPAESLMITESGIRTRDEIMNLRERGFAGFLIGETLMRSENPLATLKSYISIPNPKSGTQNLMTKVKICGITNLEDALLAAKFGADALGFNFYQKSPRYLAPEKAREIIDQLPVGILKVGVFVNETLEKIAEIASNAKLDALQLHGEETPAFARELKTKTSLEIIKAFRVSPEFKPEDVLKFETDAILLDAYNPHEHGGTGETFDWEIAKRVQEIFPKMYLAGGLEPDNIVRAISNLKPFAVDICSGVESVKGKKDNVKLVNFILRVKNHSNNFNYDNFYDFLEAVQLRPMMYLGRCQLSIMRSFLDGFQTALNLSKANYETGKFFTEFNQWAIKRLTGKHESPYGWSGVILNKTANDEEQALELFFLLLEEFKLESESISNE